MKKILLSLVVLLSFSCSYMSGRSPSSDDTPHAVKQLVDWETKANGAGIRSNDVFELKHYEVPLSILEHDFAANLDPKVKESLLFEKNGEQYVRWVINPEDTKWYLEVEKFLRANGIDTTQHSYLKGYLTASRSMIAVNPHNGSAFSIKVSTNQTGGNWKDKKQTWDDAKQIRKISDWVVDVTEKMQADNMVIQDEPFAAGIKELDQGLIVRSLNDVPTGNHFYMPGFSALHEEEGIRLARLNGVDDPIKFWKDNYVKPLAKAMAEFSAMTGVYYDSPHSQNFMIEFDENLKPTGKVVLRDFGDAYLSKDFISQTARKDILDIWEADNVVKGRFPTAVGLLHGNRAPSWLSPEDYKSYSDEFYKVYEKRFSDLTGISESTLQSTRMSHNTYSYSSKSYPVNNDEWKRLFKYSNCMSGEKTTLSGEECLEIFKKFHKSVHCYRAMGRILGD